jgi:hypothetical protein
MNPLFGLLAVLQTSMEAIGEVFGRHRKKDLKKERSERLWFAVLALLLLVGSIIAIGIAMRELYFER